MMEREYIKNILKANKNKLNEVAMKIIYNNRNLTVEIEQWFRDA